MSLAIGYRRVLFTCLVEALQHRESHERGNDVPEIDLGLAMLWIAKNLRKYIELLSNADFSGSISAMGLNGIHLLV